MDNLHSYSKISHKIKYEENFQQLSNGWKDKLNENQFFYEAWITYITPS
jgi:hypothetical protein